MATALLQHCDAVVCNRSCFHSICLQLQSSDMDGGRVATIRTLPSPVSPGGGITLFEDKVYITAQQGSGFIFACSKYASTAPCSTVPGTATRNFSIATDPIDVKIVQSYRQYVRGEFDRRVCSSVQYRPALSLLHCLAFCVATARLLEFQHGLMGMRMYLICLSFFLLLIFSVLACPSQKYGPPGCAQTCSCKNAGNCNPVTGACQCPPGYGGTTCDTGEKIITVCVCDACCISLVQCMEQLSVVQPGAMQLVLWRRWCKCTSGASSDRREPISLHQAVYTNISLSPAYPAIISKYCE